ncbi:MAG: restriction endonuclease [gamma proteobacterium symbiont of Ctena orbiculata]|nr:MAG: restriction endonuclease [gamma proteobacterium symbiont of Ctena orbiculata]
MTCTFKEERDKFHQKVLDALVRLNSDGIPNFADSSSKVSSSLAIRIYDELKGSEGSGEVLAQTSGKKFEELVSDFVCSCFTRLNHLRPGKWSFGRNRSITSYEQYIHLIDINNAAKNDTQLAAVLGRDYVVKPDIVVWRSPENDDVINRNDFLVDEHAARMASIRKTNNKHPILHASISCKWTIRSDRSQNSRTEALNLIRNRKGRLPHIVVVTAEPLPSRIASIALGTGDIDCTYHFALDELITAVDASGHEEAQNLVHMMVDGKRLRDISDLPLDIAS